MKSSLGYIPKDFLKTHYARAVKTFIILSSKAHILKTIYLTSGKLPFSMFVIIF
jgi:hypothetical protein